MPQEADGLSAARTLAKLAEEFMDLAKEMVHEQHGGRLSIDTVLRFAAQGVPGSEAASVTHVTKHSVPKTVAATSELPRHLDELQYSLRDGPLLAALDQSDVVLVNDFAAEDRWTQFARAAQTRGAASMLSFRLFLTEDQRGALNFYSSRPHAFTTAGIATGAIFASYASLVMVNLVHHDNNMHLTRALESNREIGMAMGILMARKLYTAEEAFDELRAASSQLHRRLSQVAAEVVETGALPIESAESEVDRLDSV